MSEESIADWQRMYAELRGLDPVTLEADPDARERKRILRARTARKEEMLADTGL